MEKFEFNNDKFIEAHGVEFQAMKGGKDQALAILNEAAKQTGGSLPVFAALRVEFQDGYNGRSSSVSVFSQHPDPVLFEYGLKFRSLILDVIPKESPDDFRRFVNILLVQLLVPPDSELENSK